MATRRRREPEDHEEAVVPTEVALQGEHSGGEEVDIAGEVVQEPIQLVPQPTFTPEAIKEDGKNRMSRSGVQVFGGVNVVVLMAYVFRRYLPDHMPPAEVLLELGGLMGFAFAYLMNRKRIHRGET